MNTYLVGDIHGCYHELMLLLKKVNFNPKYDTLWCTGDLVARGKYSLKILRFIKQLGQSAKIVLGNHDLNLIRKYVIYTQNTNFIDNNFKEILLAPDSEELINWLRNQPLLQIDHEKKIIMTHAGITPQWNLTTTLKYANKINRLLCSDNYKLFIYDIYRNIKKVNNWTKNLTKNSQLQFSINTLTHMRYCFSNGSLNLEYKNKPEFVPITLKPWFNIPSKIPKKYNIIFGHWSAIEGKGTPNKIYALDTGCCWGGKLTLLDWEKKIFHYQSSLQNII